MKKEVRIDEDEILKAIQLYAISLGGMKSTRHYVSLEWNNGKPYAIVREED